MPNLQNVSADDLRETLAKIDDGDAVKRLTAAITFTEIDELTQKGAAELCGFSSSWTSKWFQRLERFEEVVSGEPRDGRSRELTEQEHEQFIEVFNNPPQKSGIDAPAWSVPLARHYLREEFNVEYCERHVRRLMSEVGLSWKTARLEYNNSDERAQEAWQEGFTKSAAVWTTNK